MRGTRLVVQLVALALAIGVLSGCGTDSAPTAAADGAVGAPAAKKAAKTRITDRGARTESVTGTFTRARGGKLKVRFRGHGKKGDVWVKKATFEARRGALDRESAEITMDVTSGDSFDDVEVVFGPSGTAFEPAGTLTLELRGWKYKKDKSLSEDDLRLAADHITETGTVKAVVLSCDRRGAYKIVVTIEVPGFSLYGLRD